MQPIGINSFFHDFAEFGWSQFEVKDELTKPPLDPADVFTDLEVCDKDLSWTDSLTEKYLKLKNQYDYLYRCDQLVSGCPDVEDILVVEMDCFDVVPASKEMYLSTSSLMTCIAICARGTTITGDCFLGVAHLSVQSARMCFEKLRNSLQENGCLEHSIQFFAVGGMEKVEGHSDAGSYDTEIEILQLAKEFNIQGVLFNIVKDDEPLSIIISEESLFYTKDPDFAEKHFRISDSKFIDPLLDDTVYDSLGEEEYII